jgi:hypothetical protein
MKFIIFKFTSIMRDSFAGNDCKIKSNCCCEEDIFSKMETANTGTGSFLKILF